MPIMLTEEAWETLLTTRAPYIQVGKDLLARWEIEEEIDPTHYWDRKLAQARYADLRRWQTRQQQQKYRPLGKPFLVPPR